MQSIPESDQLLDKIDYGLKLAIKRLYEQKEANNEKVVISVNGKIKYVSSRNILKQQYPNNSSKALGLKK